jgi:hypothetical protein
MSVTPTLSFPGMINITPTTGTPQVTLTYPDAVLTESGDFKITEAGDFILVE